MEQIPPQNNDNQQHVQGGAGDPNQINQQIPYYPYNQSSDQNTVGFGSMQPNQQPNYQYQQDQFGIVDLGANNVNGNNTNLLSNQYQDQQTFQQFAVPNAQYMQDSQVLEQQNYDMEDDEEMEQDYDDENADDQDDDDDDEDLDLVALAERQRQLGLATGQPASNKISISIGAPRTQPPQTLLSNQIPIQIPMGQPQNSYTAQNTQPINQQQTYQGVQENFNNEFYSQAANQPIVFLESQSPREEEFINQEANKINTDYFPFDQQIVHQDQESQQQQPTNKIKISFGVPPPQITQNQKLLLVKPDEGQSQITIPRVEEAPQQLNDQFKVSLTNQNQFQAQNTQPLHYDQNIIQPINDIQQQYLLQIQQEEQAKMEDLSINLQPQLNQPDQNLGQEQIRLVTHIPQQQQYSSNLMPDQTQLDNQLNYQNHQQFQFEQQQQFQEQSPIPKESIQPPKLKSEKKKKRKKKGKGSFLDFYGLDKTKLTIEIDHIEKRMRAQALFTFILKDHEIVTQKLQSIEEQNFKKYVLDLGIHAKQMSIFGVYQLAGEDNKERIPTSFEYPGPEEQAKFLRTAYENLSKDLHTFETQQQQIYESQQKEPLLKIKGLIKLKCGEENLIEQFQPKVRILVEYYLEKVTNFGIQVNKFKQSYDQNGQSIEDVESNYFYTSDQIDNNELWMPIIEGMKHIPTRFIINYLAPKNYFVVSSGKLIDKQIEKDCLQRTLFVYHLNDNDKCIPDKIGFIMAKFTNIYRINDLNEICTGGATVLFTSPKKHESFAVNKIYEKNIIQIISYFQKLIQARYPYTSLKLVFVPNLILKQSRKQSLDFAGGLHILDEELIFNRNQLENRNFTYKYLASSLAFDFFGGKVFEETPEDWWLLQGLRESLGNHFKISKCGILIYRYNIMQTIQKLYKQMKYGFERFPLSSQHYPHPSEQQMNDIVYQKCELIMHMIESMIDKSYYERIIRQIYDSANPTISQGLFHNIFKQVCGFKLKQFFQNWIISTSCPKLTASFNYNKKNNSLDLNIAQTSAMKSYFSYKRFTKNLIEMKQIFSLPSFSFKHINSAMAKQNQNVDSFLVELKRGCMRYFTGEVNVMIYLTDGAEIQTQQQKMSLRYGKSQVSVNIPLQCKVKKTIQNKKKEYENMLMYDQEMHQDDERGDDNMNNNGQNDHHMIDNMQWKFGLNDFELEDYPYGTKNLFDVKNLESPVLWIRVDPDMEFIRKVKVVQEQNNWLFQLLQEKDIIGQIEAINELNKFNSELVYEILKSVSTNENYFFKVRKIAIKKLQQMQTSQFNKYLSHEKFLIKVFNQRNFDKSIGFYKSNDFSKVLEYYIDKSILKTLSKCKEVPLELKEEIKEYLLNQQKQQQNQPNESATQPPGTISINISSNEVVQQKQQKLNSKYNEKYFNVSSEQIGQLLMRLLQENDNSENPFDDSFYIKQILKALGNLDCFKLLPEIATEIYRQYRLDYIGKYSPQFSITKGSIAGYFKLRKQIFLFKTEKIKNIDTKIENVDWYLDQIDLAERQTLNQMGSDLDKMIEDDLWPYEVRSFVQFQNIKHCFMYQNNHFLKALYIQLKKCEEYLTKTNYKYGTDLIKQMAMFLEANQDILDFRECYLDNDKSKGVTELLWNMLLLPFNFLNAEFTYWLKRLYYFIFGNETPLFFKEQQTKQGSKNEVMQYDEYWSRIEDQLADANALMQQQNDDKNQHLKQILAQKQSTKVVVGIPNTGVTQKSEKIVIQDLGQKQHEQQPESKLKIVLAPFFGEQTKQSWNPSANQTQEKSIKIVLGGLQIEPFKSNTYSQDQQMNQMREEQNQQIQLMQSLSHQPIAQHQINLSSDQYYDAAQYDDNESVYDEFAEIKFTDTPWLQAAWEILGTLWYHEEAGAFLSPVSEDDLGSYFEDYLRTIDYPMDLSTMKLKAIERLYRNFQEFKRDALTVFRNCQKFNHESSEIHQASVKLENFFKRKLLEYQRFDQAIIRIS